MTCTPQSGTSDSNPPCYKKRWEVLYNISLGIRYHMLRQQFFGKWHRVTSALSLAFSTSAVATIANGTKWGIACAAAVAILQAVDLIVETRKNSELHNELRREYISLETDLLDYPQGLTDDQYKIIQAKVKAIELKEPPVMRTLLLMCRNDVNAVYRTGSQEKVNWFWRFTANFIS